jgi:hypothetical protein
MNYNVLQCGHCGTENALAACDQCGRYFVVTQSHLEGELRTFESVAASIFPETAIELCDFCFAQASDRNPAEVVAAGMAQQTCAACHTEFLSQHGLRQKDAF